MAVAARDFFDFVKAIGESKSKQEEDRIIADEVVYLKKAVPQQQSGSKKKVKEILVKAIYVEMLGHEASFAYIKAVEMCASTNIIHKRVGYLTAYLCLSPSHELRFMLINQLQRDMKSSNQLESCAALAAVCKLITEDMIPAVNGEIIKLLFHEMETVRKRAVIAFHRLYQLDKSVITGHTEKIRKILCDKDPSVMAGSLPLLQAMIHDDVNAYKDLVPSFVSILKQITEHRLPKDYDYHRMPAPWIQMNILRILASLGRGNQASSEGMYEVLVDVMKRADTGINVGYAVVWAVITVTSIYPNPTLLDAAATAISRFIRSDSHNLKYIGIKGLAAIVKDHPRYAADHQMAVIDCLEDPDETLKRKTLDLLFRMTNSVNVEFIVEKLLSFLSSASDDHFRTDLVGQITQCAERYAPSNAWYVQTIVRVFELAGDKVKMSVAQTLMQLIAEGAADEDADEGNPDDILRMDAVEDFLELLESQKLPEILAQTMAWVLGEYGHLSESHTKEQIMDKLCKLFIRTNNPVTRAQILTALMKLVAQSGSCPQQVHKLITLYADSLSLDLQERCVEFLGLLNHSNILADALPVDASCEDIEVDKNLSFLNGYVSKALALGAIPYSPPNNADDDDDDTGASKRSGLKIAPYERPSAPAVIPGSVAALGIVATPGPTPLGPAITNPSPILTGAAAQGNQLLNSRGAAAVWGKKPELPPPPPPVPEVAPPPAPAPILSSVAAPISTTVVNPVAALVPEGPRQLSQKELLAQAIFGGVGASSNTSNAASRAAARASKRSSQGGVKPTSDLVDTSLPPAPVAVAVPAVNNQTDLLDMGLGSDTFSPAPAVVPLTVFPAQSVAPSPPIETVVSPPIASVSDAFSSLNMESSYSTSGFNSLTVSAPTAFSTGSRPLPLTTNEFGQKWMQNVAEVKQTIATKIRSLEQLKAAIPASFAHVESISATSEAIFAATAANGSAVLLHVKLHAPVGTSDVTVKSSNKETSSREYGVIASALTSF